MKILKRKRGAGSKTLREADDISRLAHKVWHYRRDVLSADQLDRLEGALERLERVRQDPEASGDDLKTSISETRSVLEVTGGAFYTKRSWSDNIEMFLVAAILAIGARTYFIQPFKIPTNSMYPTYNGMTHELYLDAEEAPGALGSAFRFITLGASRKVVEAEASGEVIIPLRQSSSGYIPFVQRKPGRKWFGLLPAVVDEYTILIDNKRQEIQVPADFGLTKVLYERFGAPTQLTAGPGGSLLYHTGQRVQAGDRLMTYDILTGDQLFVDRFTYHFRKPRVGEPFVFRTDEIPGVGVDNLGKYYIKRLVAAEGDVLEVRDPVLYRNGKPIEGAEAFELNATRSGGYEGYTSEKFLAEGHSFTVPENSYFAMGDNSDESSDSRYWGAVPEKAVVGKAIFIYYPFSKRFGVAE